MFFVVFSLTSEAQVIGSVTDNFGQAVENALVTFSDIDSAYHYQVTTDENGFFTLNIPVLRSNQLTNMQVYDIYPNPALNKTVVPVFLPEEMDITFEVFTITGKKVTHVQKNNIPSGLHQEMITLPAIRAHSAVAELYIIQVTGDNKSVYQKLVVVNDPSIGAAIYPINLPGSVSPVSYAIQVSGNGFDTLTIETTHFAEDNHVNLRVLRKLPIPFSVTGNYIGCWNGTIYEPLFLKGINLGVSVPGTLPGELAASGEQYMQWIEKIHETGFNVIRTYTLHYPRFYDALRTFNLLHPDNPLYLLQGIWLNEEVPDYNLFTLSEEFTTDIKEAVQEIGVLVSRHGSAFLSKREGILYNGNNITIRLPWSLLNFTDPSKRTVMDDTRNTIPRETAVSQGISVSVIHLDEAFFSDRYIWDGWDVARPYQEVEKVSLRLMKEGLKQSFPPKED